jgi:hypothetical protein
MALSITTLSSYAECHYAQCHILFVGMLSVVILNVAMLRVVVPLSLLKKYFYFLTKQAILMRRSSVRSRSFQ